MRRKKVLPHIIVVLAVVLAMVLMGCTTTQGDFRLRTSPLAYNTVSPNFHVLGTVQMEQNFVGVVGLNIPFLNIGAFTFQSGGTSYANLLAEARRHFPGTDAVIDIRVDIRQSGRVPVVFTRRTYIVTGIAIRYDRDESMEVSQPQVNLPVQPLQPAAPPTVNPITVTPQPAGPPTVTFVTVSPQAVEVRRGRTQHFTATVSGTDNPPQTVIWTVERVNTEDPALQQGTRVDNGLLIVASNEIRHRRIRVRATSTLDNSISGTTLVTIR